MPEGPEVRKYADALDKVLSGRLLTSLEARTRDARAWLKDNEARLIGRRVERVISHGKHLIGYLESDFFFHSHLMMWGRWQTFAPVVASRKIRKKSEPLVLPEKDRRERARIVVEGGAALLLSAPIFNVGEGRILTTRLKTSRASGRMCCLTTGNLIRESFVAVCLALIT